MDSPYDREYFFSFDDYIKIEQAQPIPISSWNEYKFNFYEIRFKNNVIIYFFYTLKETLSFKNYINTNNILHTGLKSDINERIIFESIKRNVNDFLTLSNELAEGRDFCLLYNPNKLSFHL